MCHPVSRVVHLAAQYVRRILELCHVFHPGGKINLAWWLDDEGGTTLAVCLDFVLLARLLDFMGVSLHNQLNHTISFCILFI
jgi:hypothetical protein